MIPYIADHNHVYEPMCGYAEGIYWDANGSDAGVRYHLLLAEVQSGNPRPDVIAEFLSLDHSDRKMIRDFLKEHQLAYVEN